ncbi:MAG: GNAT family N-acetyltransferase [Candidatus Saccharimonadales bacterium]
MDDIELIEIDAHRDAPLATSWINGPGGAKTLQLMSMLVPDDFKTTEVQEFERFKQIQNNPNELAWMIEYDGLVVGIVEVNTVSFEGLQPPNISIMIGDISARGKGIGTVAMSQTINILKDKGYETIFARVLTRNAPSITMLKKLGFAEDGEPYTDGDTQRWQNVRYEISQ